VTITADPPVGSINPPAINPPAVIPRPSASAAVSNSHVQGLLTANTDRIIATPNGDISIKAGSLVFVTTRDGTTSIFNLSWKGGVSIGTAAGTIPVLPGRAMVISDRQSTELNKLLRSNNASDRKLAQQMLKTAAALMVMRRSGLSAIRF
jgi:hypothetical protein